MKILCSTQMIQDSTVLGQTMRALAIATALQRRGHDVAFLVGGRLLPVVRSHGIRVVEAPPPEALSPGFLSLLSEDEAERAEARAQFVALLPRLVEVESRAIAAERPDVLVCGDFSGPLAAEAARLPCALVMLQPHGERTLRALTQHLGRAPELEALVERAAEASGLFLIEGVPELGPGAALPFAWAERVAHRVRHVGPLLLEPPDALPSREELRMRHTGKATGPLVYVTIGGGSPLIGEGFLALVLEALGAAPELRGFVATGLDLAPERLPAAPPNVQIHGFVPGAELIKASDVTVFHGGSSTLMTCLACGTPGVVVPSMEEQEDNGAVLAREGAGIVLEKSALTAAALLDAVRSILRDGCYRANAVRLRERCRYAGGADRAAALVEGLATAARHAA